MNTKFLVKFLLIFLILCITLLPSISYGYSNEYFEIKLPEHYEIIETDNIYQFKKDAGATVIIITISDNKDKKSLEELDNSEFRSGFKSSFVETAKKTNTTNFSISDGIIEKLGDNRVLVFDIFMSNANISMYQKCYCAYTEKYNILISVMTNDNEYLNSVEYTQIRDSIKILDKDAVSNNSLYSDELINYSSEFKSGYTTGAIFSYVFIPFCCYEISKYKERKYLDKKPLSWYKFYNYFIIPFNILLDISPLINCFRIRKFEVVDIFITILAIIFLIMEFNLFRCMHKKKKGTFKLLTFLIFIKCGIFILFNITNTILPQIDKYEFIQLLPYISNIVYSIIWIVLNIMYFKKRKDIFIN